jgi:hypothetical protein
MPSSMHVTGMSLQCFVMPNTPQIPPYKFVQIVGRGIFGMAGMNVIYIVPYQSRVERNSQH